MLCKIGLDLFILVRFLSGLNLILILPGKFFQKVKYSMKAETKEWLKYPFIVDLFLYYHYIC